VGGLTGGTAVADRRLHQNAAHATLIQ
jgi:hypothetical protein